MTFQEKTIYRGKIWKFDRMNDFYIGRKYVSLSLAIDQSVESLTVILDSRQEEAEQLYASVHDAFNCDLRCTVSFERVGDENRLLTFEVLG